MTAFPENEQLTDQLFKKISRYVYDHCRINLTENKRELVRARLAKVIRQRGMKGYRDYYHFMENDKTGEAMREVLNAVSTNLTSFFRENQHFEFMQTNLIPKILNEKAASGNRRIRGWSAGSSTGEEVYSITITVLECMQKPSDWDFVMLASDIDTNVLEKGQQGIYDKKRVENMSKSRLNSCFAKFDDKSYQVNPDIRSHVRFRRLNLMEQWPFKRGFDFIFCRNVMIYFDQPTQQMLVNKFYNNLAPGGHLFIGHSEGLTGVEHKFKYIRPTIYMKPK